MGNPETLEASIKYFLPHGVTAAKNSGVAAEREPLICKIPG
jgi:hypothetical protein